MSAHNQYSDARTMLWNIESVTFNSFMTKVVLILWYCSANQWTGFYMTTASVMKELKEKSVKWVEDSCKTKRALYKMPWWLVNVCLLAKHLYSFSLRLLRDTQSNKKVEILILMLRINFPLKWNTSMQTSFPGPFFTLLNWEKTPGKTLIKCNFK